MGVLVDGWSRYSSQRLLVDSSSEASKDLYIEQVNTCVYIYICTCLLICTCCKIKYELVYVTNNSDPSFVFFCICIC